MAITFTRAQEVVAGQKPTSTQIRSLARAWKDRQRSGVGDVAWRTEAYLINLWRMVRNPAGYLFPAMAEWFHLYQAIEPWTGLTWPVAPPGEEEGANLANPAMQFYFGVGDTDSEHVRISDPIMPLDNDGTPAGIWELRKSQAGLYDPATGAINAPAWDAAQSIFRFAFPYQSPHHKSYGGFFPSPVELLEDCGTTETSGLGIPSYEIFLTGLTPDVAVPPHHGTLTYDGEGRPVVTYAGTCPCGTDQSAAGHVVWVGRWPFAYYLYVTTGTPCDPGSGTNLVVDTFDAREWIEGPYTGEERIQRADGGQLQLSVWSFLQDFRGTEAQRGGHPLLGDHARQSAGSDKWKIDQIAFPVQEFMTRQYALAPNRAVTAGNDLVAQFPMARWLGAQTANAFGKFADQRTQYDYADGFVLGGFFAVADGLREACVLEIMDGSAPVAAVALDPDPSGHAEAYLWLKAALRPEPLRAKLPGGARLDPDGTILVEFTEQVEYLPNYWDAYLVARLGATYGSSAIQGGVDGRGIDEAESAGLADSMFDYGALVNRRGALGTRMPAEWVNDSPVYDAARRLTRDLLRIVRREELVSYEEVGGKSVLRFRRFGFGMHEARIDLFHGIAPPLDPVGSDGLIDGETYLVRGTEGAVDYAGQSFQPGQEFTAGAALGFVASGDCEVYVKDGIRHTALKRGWTNEWLLRVNAKRYHPSPTSIWKPDAYADFFPPLLDRCLFYGGNVPSKSFRAHIGYQWGVDLDDETFQPFLLDPTVQATLIAPEAPSGYRYAKASNQNAYVSEEFRASCQLYEAPYEIESCVVDQWIPDQVITITLTGRLTAHPDAPASVNVDPSAWSADEVAILRNEYLTDPTVNEDYRTDGNAVREYVWHLHSGQQCTVKAGDSGSSSSVDSLPDNPAGCCYPTFVLSRLMSEPYEDENDLSEAHDARAAIDAFLHAAILTRAGCEGFVDGQTTASMVCDYGHGGLFDYSFEALCFEAFSGKWLGPMSSGDRPDAPMGFGPLVNTPMRAEVWNRLAKSVNLLDKARLDFPFMLYSRACYYVGQREEEVVVTSGPAECTTGSATGFYLDGASAPAVAYDSCEPWDYATGFEASDFVRLKTSCPFGLERQQTQIEFRAVPNSPFLETLRQELRDLVDAGSSGFVASLVDTATAEKRQSTAPGGGDTCFTLSPWGDNTWTDSGPAVPPDRCLVVTSGVLICPAPPISDLKMCWVPGSGTCFNQSGTSTTLGIVSDSGFFLRVPLVDL